jgi:putative transposase
VPDSVKKGLPELYLHGLALGDFELAVRGLFGGAAPLSESSIAWLMAEWEHQYQSWCQRSLAELDIVYRWADGLYVKAGIENGKAAPWERRLTTAASVVRSDRTRSRGLARNHE